MKVAIFRNARTSALLLAMIAAAPAGLAIGQTVKSQSIYPNSEFVDPVPLEISLDSRKVRLGELLFSDTRMSAGNEVSCSTCHDLEKAGQDGLKLSRGLPGNPAYTNTPTLFNVGLSTKFNWDGHNTTLQRQVDEVVQKKNGMGAEWPDVVALLRSDPAMTSAFSKLYPDGVQRQNIIDAIVQFERSLITPNAPFDRYLRGETDAISDDAKDGYKLFKDYGCVFCHQGVNIGGNMLQAFGIFDKEGRVKSRANEPGAATGTGISNDRPVFRVPSLRNVAETAPYFHNGEVPTLREAIDTMAEVQIGRTLTEEETTKIEIFLQSLSGEYKGRQVRASGNPEIR